MKTLGLFENLVFVIRSTRENVGLIARSFCLGKNCLGVGNDLKYLPSPMEGGGGGVPDVAAVGGVVPGGAVGGGAVPDGAAGGGAVWGASPQLCMLQASCSLRTRLHFPLATHFPYRLRNPPPQELVHELHERKLSSES